MQKLIESKPLRLHSRRTAAEIATAAETGVDCGIVTVLTKVSKSPKNSSNNRGYCCYNGNDYSNDEANPICFLF